MTGAARDWFAVFAGPLAWFTAHVASWMIAPGAHEAGGTLQFLVIDAAALALALTGGMVALRRMRALLRVAPVARVPRERFVTGAGLALSALSVLLVIGLALPVLLLAPGAEP
jgi:hypothetical protein